MNKTEKNRINNFCRSAFLTLVVVTPLYYGSVDPWVIYLIEAAIFLTLFVWFRGMIGNEKIRFYLSDPIFYMGLFLLLGLISFWFTDYKWIGRRELVLYTAGIGAYFLAAHLFNRTRYLHSFCRVLLILATTLSFVGIMQYMGLLAHSWWSGYQLSATYVNKNHFAGYLNMVIPFAITGIYFAEDSGKRILRFYSLIVLLVALILTFSRGGWTSFLFSSIFLTLNLFEPEKKRIKWATISFFIVPILFLLFASVGVKNIEYMSEGKDNTQINWPLRRRMYRSTMALIRRHWLLGSGPGSFATTFPRYRVPGLNHRIDYAHNDYLQIVAELGIGVIPLLLLIIGTSYKAAKEKIRSSPSQTEKGVTLASMAGILSILVHSLFDFNLRIPANAFLFLTLLGLATAHPLFSRKSRARTLHVQASS